MASQSLTVPAPIGGLNAHDALAAMPPTDAVTLDNFFPNPTSVNLRNGYKTSVTGINNHVESLMVWNGSSGSKLIAAAGANFYDVTTPGAVGAAVVTGNTSARWQYSNMGTTGGQYIVCVNGVDLMQIYDGTTWQQVTGVSAPIAITGVATSALIGVNMYKTRLFFIENNSFHVWYMPVNSIGGAAAKLDLSPLFRLGGYLMAMTTWTIDNASGINEFATFISSEGEIVIYNGTDPSNASTWAIDGTFRVGRPIGRRCFEKVASDVYIVSADGLYPLSKALLTDRSQDSYAISNKITNLINNDVQAYAANFGWECKLYPIGNKIIINVPQTENKVQYQYVMNTITNSWCRFTNWNANCFAVIQDKMYFGSNLSGGANSAFVAQCDVGYSDNGAYVFGEAKTAFQYFGAPGRSKRFTMVRPIFQNAGTMQAALAMDVDFADSNPTGTPTFTGGFGSLWNTSLWNTFGWGDISGVKKDWQGVTGIGDAGALHMKIVNNKTPVQWQSIEYVFEVSNKAAAF